MTGFEYDIPTNHDPNIVIYGQIFADVIRSHRCYDDGAYGSDNGAVSPVDDGLNGSFSSA